MKTAGLQAVVELLVGHEADVNARSSERLAALHVIAANNSVNSLHRLLPFIDDVNVTDGAGRTALHHAANNGHTQVGTVPRCRNVLLRFQQFPAGLCFTGITADVPFLFFQREISVLRRPIDAKLCHVVGSVFNVITQVPKFRGPPAKKNLGPKTCKIRGEFGQL